MLAMSSSPCLRRNGQRCERAMTITRSSYLLEQIMIHAWPSLWTVRTVSTCSSRVTVSLLTISHERVDGSKLRDPTLPAVTPKLDRTRSSHISSRNLVRQQRLLVGHVRRDVVQTSRDAVLDRQSVRNGLTKPLRCSDTSTVFASANSVGDDGFVILEIESDDVTSAGVATEELPDVMEVVLRARAKAKEVSFSCFESSKMAKVATRRLA